MWDVINEVVIMPEFDKYDNAVTRICKEYGRLNLVKEVFAKPGKGRNSVLICVKLLRRMPLLMDQLLQHMVGWRNVLWCTALKVRYVWIPDNEEVQEKFRCKNDQKGFCVKVVTQDPFMTKRKRYMSSISSACRFSPSGVVGHSGI